MPKDETRPQRDEQQKSPRRNTAGGNDRHVKAQEAIKELEGEVNKFRRILSKLKPIPPPWSESIGKKPLPDAEGYGKLVDDARAFVDRVQATVEKGQLSKRFTREVCFFLEQSLQFFQISFIDCERILKLARKWNLSLSDQKAALNAACFEGRWKEAADMFLQLVDPDRDGYSPMEIDLRYPIGLYAIARDAQERGTPVAESVMSAVMSMIMVNPSDQNKYVLAAGSALGLAGAWEELIEYQRSSYNSSRLGQTLVGAAMYACIQNGRTSKARGLFEKLAVGDNSAASEWHWGGGVHVIDPVVRDIAIRAGGSEARELFLKAKEEGFQVSFQALVSVINASTSLEEVSAILLDLLDDASWVVDADSMEISHHGDKKTASCLARNAWDEILLCFMRWFNHDGNFALTAISCELLLPPSPQTCPDWREDLVNRIFLRELSNEVPDNDVDDNTNLMRFTKRDEQIAALMTAMCGLGCPNLACQVFEKATNKEGQSFAFSTDVFRHASTLVPMGYRWECVHGQVRQLVTVVRSLPSDKLTPAQSSLLLDYLATTMKGCNCDRQGGAALFLLSWVQTRIMPLLRDRGHTIQGTVGFFLGVDDEEKSSSFSLLHQSDALLSETVRAVRLSKSPEEALALLDEVLGQNTDKHNSFPLSVAEALIIFISERQTDEALSYFKSLGEDVWTPDMFLTILRGLEEEQRWTDMVNMYHLALKSGCLTEQVGLLAMKALAENKEHEGIKLPILRGIVKELYIQAGLVESDWLYSKYWIIKRYLGVRYSRLLMWWNDKRTSDVFELQLAINQFTERKEAGLKPRNDVLRAIVRHCQHFTRLSTIIKELELPLPAEREAWTELLGYVVAEARDTSLHNNRPFVEGVILALHAIGADAVLVEYLAEARVRGVNVDESFLSGLSHQTAAVTDMTD